MLELGKSGLIEELCSTLLTNYDKNIIHQHRRLNMLNQCLHCSRSVSGTLFNDCGAMLFSPVNNLEQEEEGIRLKFCIQIFHLTVEKQNILVSVRRPSSEAGHSPPQLIVMGSIGYPSLIEIKRRRSFWFYL